jgi:hypothetical protein
MTGSSTQGIKAVLHPVSDLAKAKAVYAALLGVPPQADAPYYVGFEAEASTSGWWPPSATPMATSSGCFRTDEPSHRGRSAGWRHDEHGHDGHAVACAARW